MECRKFRANNNLSVVMKFHIKCTRGFSINSRVCTGHGNFPANIILIRIIIEMPN